MKEAPKAVVAVQKTADATKVTMEASKTGDAETKYAEVKVEVNQLVEQDVCDEFVCKICMVHVVGSDPKLTKCSHLFCGDCLAQWFKVQPTSLSWAQRAKTKGKVPCPVCKDPLDPKEDVFPVCEQGPNHSAFLWKMLSGLQVKCSNDPSCNPCGKCNWKGTYSDFQEHIKVCENLPVFDDAASTDAGTEYMTENLRCESMSSSCGDVNEEDSFIEGNTDSEKSDTEVVAQEMEEEEQEEEPALEVEPKSESICEAEVHSNLDAKQSSELSSSLQTASLQDLFQQLFELERKKKEKSPAVEAPAAALQEGSSALRAVNSFTAGDSSQLTVAVGDLLDVVQQDASGWTLGRKAGAATQGWFPQWVLESH
jgi:hypothetical protein